MAGHRQKCMVPGCEVGAYNLSYMRKNVVCLAHQQAESVMLYGWAWRFCQRCRRFQLLSGFVQDSRICDPSARTHNFRRRERYAITKAIEAHQQGIPGALALLPDLDSSDSDDEDAPPAAAGGNNLPPPAGGAAPQAAHQAPPAPAAAVEPQHPFPAGAAHNNGMAAPDAAGAQPAPAAVEQQNPVPAGAGAAVYNGMAAGV